MIAIVVSEADRASEHVGEHLLDLADWDDRRDPDRDPAAGGGEYHVREGFELRTFEELHLYVEDAAAAFDDPDLLVFASRHSGETGPLLTAHFTGNFGPAEYGGSENSLAEACPGARSRLIESFAAHAPDGYEVGTECTHHGPSEVGCPSMFVEVGSAEPQWEDPEAAEAAARSILDMAGVAPHGEKQLVGFGGGHYAPRFTRIDRETPWSVGHVAADWGLDAMGAPGHNRGVIRAAFERSNAEHAVIDGDYPDLVATVEDLGYRVVSETWVRAVGDRPLDVVRDVERRLGSVEDGVRFGDRTGPFEVVEFPQELLEEAQGIDLDAAFEAVASTTVAFQTREGATKATGRAAVPEGGYDELVDELVAILRRSYDSVERTADAVLARETAFDPGRAHDLGVPEGPAFGKLASGQSVEVDGEEVTPDQVTERRERAFPI